MNAGRRKRSINKLLKKGADGVELSCLRREEKAGSPNVIPFPPTMSSEHRWEIISAFGRVLEQCSSPVEKESDLPYPKDLIRQAIYEELLDNPDAELRSHLEIAFVQLEAFLPPEEYKVLQDFKLASILAQEIAKSGDPGDIIASARILKEVKGDRAVRIQERISEKMQRRLEQIQSIGMTMFTARPCPDHLGS